MRVAVRFHSLNFLSFMLALLIFTSGTSAAGQTYTVIHTFTGGDGGQPDGNLILDAAGNLYGTASTGGDDHCNNGCGVVYELTPTGGGAWAESTLYSFKGGNDGFYPVGGVVFDAAGNLYGTTTSGGTFGFGTVFKLDTGRTKTVLYNFSGGDDGAYPTASLVRDSAGNFYGTTYYRGAYEGGTAFKVARVSGHWRVRVIHPFGGSNDGLYPAASLVLDSTGNLYGTTFLGGKHGAGTAFELTPVGGRWKESVLTSFEQHSGDRPTAGLTIDPAGNLYGAASDGGAHGGGTVVELTPSQGGRWNGSVLYSFLNGSDGGDPLGSLILDAVGNLYGTTSGGGLGGGTVFRLVPNVGGSQKTLLYTFTDLADGGEPVAALVMDASGNLYGTTHHGGDAEDYYGHGVVFEITP